MYQMHECYNTGNTAQTYTYVIKIIQCTYVLLIFIDILTPLNFIQLYTVRNIH